jgi:hypothetical protein
MCFLEFSGKMQIQYRALKLATTSYISYLRSWKNIVK